jgi:hypothetical protein
MNDYSLRPQPVARSVRGWFAPVARESGTPAVFDPSRHDPTAPGAPWVGLGALANFRRAALTRHEILRSGAKGAPAAQVRRELGARVDFDFRDWGKLQMALAGGSQHMNVLAADVNADAFPSGGSPRDAIALLLTSTAQELVFGAGAVEAFAVGDLIAVDLDYEQQVGYIGSGVSGAYVKDALTVLHDRHYVRRVSFNVGRAAVKTTTSVILAQPLIGGAPPAGASAQKVVAFVDREGGSFFQEWSALFVVEDENGARVCFHYPRLQAASPAAEERTQIDPTLRQNRAEGCATHFESWALHASFLALPTEDVNDGEQVLCYRSYFPAPSTALY